MICGFTNVSFVNYMDTLEATVYDKS